MSEPSPISDNGPYADVHQAVKQYDALVYGVPAERPEVLNSLVLVTALAITGVRPSDYEREVLDKLMSRIDAPTAQVLTGWIMRACKAGQDRVSAQ